MDISFIGAGKAALSLASYFKKKGHKILYITDKDKNREETFLKQINCKTEDIENIVKKSQILFLTVNDNSIYSLWESIPKNKETIFIHCSGAKEGLYNGDCNLYALHPVAPLTGNDELENICFGLENFGDKVYQIKDFIETMGNTVFLINKDKKAQYHLASVMASNLVLSLIERSVSYLKECDLSEEEAIELLMPLAKQNLLNIEKYGVKKSITGPASRGDYEICKNHIKVIKNEEDKKNYTILSKNILRILGKNEEEFNKKIK